MAKFRKKPVVIDALQWEGGLTRLREIQKALPDMDTLRVDSYGGNVPLWIIRTLDGPIEVRRGDWIIRGVAGEYYPCRPDIFEATYELAE